MKLLEDIGTRLKSEFNRIQNQISAISILASGGMPYALLTYEMPSGSFGGPIPATGNWVLAILNTIKINEGSIVSLASNRFTLQPGKYRISAKKMLCGVWYAGLRLYNFTDRSEVQTVVSSQNQYLADIVDFASLDGQVTISGAKQFQIEIHGQNTTGNGDLGQPLSISGRNEVFTILEIWKLA